MKKTCTIHRVEIYKRLRGKREKIALNLVMRKSLVTFGSVESQWNDKGRSQIAGRRDRVGGPEVHSSFKIVKVGC